MSKFTYKEPALPDDCTFRISPSQIYKFFDYPSVWYRDNFLGENSFKGNTASELGTIIHQVAESVAKHESISKDEVEAYIDSIDNPDVDKEVIREHCEDMVHTLVNNYIIHNMPTDVEYETVAPVSNGVYVGGTVDNRTHDMIVDYKNVGKKPDTESIPFKYKIQLLAYAYADKARGIFTDRIRIVYTVRRTKTLPVRVFVVTEVISDEDWKLIEDTLNLIADTVTLHKEQPKLIPYLYKSMELVS